MMMDHMQVLRYTLTASPFLNLAPWTDWADWAKSNAKALPRKVEVMMNKLGEDQDLDENYLDGACKGEMCCVVFMKLKFMSNRMHILMK